MRGLAIIGIFLHNYCHWLGPVVKENEYMFNRGNADWLWSVTQNADQLLPMHWISFFGHYGVPVFLFLSAYGLEKKYGSSLAAKEESVWAFVKKHFKKLFSMMIVGFAAFTMIDAITPSRWHYDVVKILAQMLMVGNLLPDPDHQIWPGPYWFFGLMLQLYIVYRLFIYRRHWGITVGLMAACVAMQLMLPPTGDAINSYRYNFMGGMLPFGLGILLSRSEERRVKREESYSLFDYSVWQWTLIAIVSSLLTIAMSYSLIGWTFAPVMVIVACMAVAKVAEGIPGIGRWLLWMGEISAALFVCHPITRKIFIPISRHGDYWTGLLLYIIASIILAMIFKELMKKIRI